MYVAMKWSTYAAYQLAAFGLGGLTAALLVYVACKFRENYDEAKTAGVVR